VNLEDSLSARTKKLARKKLNHCEIGRVLMDASIEHFPANADDVNPHPDGPNKSLQPTRRQRQRFGSFMESGYN